MKVRKALIAGVFIGSITANAQAETPDNALVMAYNIDAISSFDPAQIAEAVTNEIIMNTCDALVDNKTDDEATVVPNLAKSWDVSEDGRVITFHLRDGIVFPDGTPGTAADLVWSMQRVVKLGFGNAAALIEYGFTEDSIDERIKALDDKTITMQLDKAYPVGLVLAAIGANRVSSMLNRAVLEENETDGDLGNGYLKDKTACVGPYQLARWNPGESVLLQANEIYDGPAPKLSRILIRHVAEPGTQRLLLENGEVDVARDLTSQYLTDLEANDQVEVVRKLNPSLFYMGMNVSKAPFDDPKVRLAMRHVIDYQGLADTVMKGIGIPRNSYVQLGAFGALSEEDGLPFKQNLGKAKELLVEAGYPDGFKASLIIGTQPYSNSIAQSVQEAASQVGVTLEIEPMANAQLYARNRARDFDAALLAYKAGVPDAHGMSSRFVFNPDNALEAKNTQYPSWRAAYYDETMNSRVEEALFEVDPEERMQLYHDLQIDMMQEGPMAYIMQTLGGTGVRKEVKNWTSNGFRIYYDLASK